MKQERQERIAASGFLAEANTGIGAKVKHFRTFLLIREFDPVTFATDGIEFQRRFRGNSLDSEEAGHPQGNNLMSWNETCFLTHLPIRYQDPVVALIVHPNIWSRCDETRSRTNPSYLYQTLGFPIVGTYDSYGSVEGLQLKLSVRLLLDFLTSDNRLSASSDATRTGQNPLEYQNKEQVQAAAEELLRHIRYNHLLLKNHLYREEAMLKHLPLSLILMHREAFQAVTENDAKNNPTPLMQLLPAIYQDMKHPKTPFGNQELRDELQAYFFSSENTLVREFLWRISDRRKNTSYHRLELEQLWQDYSDLYHWLNFLQEARINISPTFSNSCEGTQAQVFLAQQVLKLAETFNSSDDGDDDIF